MCERCVLHGWLDNFTHPCPFFTHHLWDSPDGLLAVVGNFRLGFILFGRLPLWFYLFSRSIGELRKPESKVCARVARKALVVLLGVSLARLFVLNCFFRLGLDVRGWR